MTLIVLKFNYTRNDLPLLKRIQLRELGFLRKSGTYKVTVLRYFVVFKVDFQE